MNSFDFILLQWITAYANTWPWFDGLLAFLVNWEIAKGGFILTLYWWSWFQPEKHREQHRARLLVALAAAMLALAVAAVAALAFPYRPRPRVLVGMEPPSGGWAEWSAFPSDHATLFFALTAGLWTASRRLGIVALLHAVFVVCWPRVYLGLHYPTDILAGAGIGTVVALVAQRRQALLSWAQATVRWSSASPARFYALGFVATYSLATLFADWRRAANTLVAWWLRQ